MSDQKRSVEAGAGSDRGYELLSLDELDRLATGSGSPLLLPLRRHLGFRSFGVNCWSAAEPGEHVIERHAERSGDEELYVVVRGRASFTVEGESADAPAGTLVHVPPDTLRQAVAVDPDTLVLAVGARPGEPWQPKAWEDFYVAEGLRSQGRVDEARALVAQVLAGDPDAWQGHYNAACFEALSGDRDAALGHLADALARDRVEVRRVAVADADLDALRDDPRFEELVG